MGPITQPKLVGQQQVSPAWVLVCAHESAAHRIGESCVHGIAFGSPTDRPQHYRESVD